MVAAGSLGYGKCAYLCNQSQDLFQVYRPLAEDMSGDYLTAYDTEIRDMYLYKLEQYIMQGGGMQESIDFGEEIRDALEEMISSR